MDQLKNIKQTRHARFIYCEKIIKLISLHGEEALTFSFLSRELNLPLASLYNLFPSSSQLIVALQAYFQENFLKATEDIKDDLRDDEITAKEILLELILVRLESLSPYKKACEILLKNQIKDLQATPKIVETFFDSIKWLLDLANLQISGPYGLTRSKVLGFIYLETAQVWFKDTSWDLTSTSAHLNERLDQAEKLFPLIWKRF